MTHELTLHEAEKAALLAELKRTENKNRNRDNHGQQLDTTKNVKKEKLRCLCRFRMAEHLNATIVKVLQAVGRGSIRHAHIILVLVPIFSVSMFCLGLFTNFHLEVDRVKLWTPESSPVIENSQWIANESGFPSKTYPIHVLLHADGDNVITMDAVHTLFQALTIFENTEGYDELCGNGTENDSTTSTQYGTPHDCTFSGATNFFDDGYDTFRQKVKNDNDLILAVSAFPLLSDGRIVQRERMFGYRIESGDERNLVVSAKSLKLRLGLPDTSGTRTFESKAIRNLLDFRSELRLKPASAFHVEVLSLNSYTNETERAVFNDLPLIPVMVTIMFAFSCMVYYRKDQVESSCLFLGIGGVMTVVFSLLTSFGLLFCIGVPFSSLTASTPFVILGIGLDGEDARLLCRCSSNISTAKTSHFLSKRRLVHNYRCISTHGSCGKHCQ